MARNLAVQLQADKIVQAICGIVISDNPKFTKSAAGQIIQIVTSLRGIVTELGVVRKAEMGSSVPSSVVEVAPTMGAQGVPRPAGDSRSYANAAKLPPKPRAKPVRVAAKAKPTQAQPEKKVVLVKSALAAVDLDNAALRRKLRDTVKPRQNGIRASVFNTKAGIVVVAEDEAARGKILAADVALAGSVLSASQGEKPRVRIYDVPAHMEGKEVKESIFGQNFDEADRDVLKKEFGPLFKLGPKSRTPHSGSVKCLVG